VGDIAAAMGLYERLKAPLAAVEANRAQAFAKRGLSEWIGPPHPLELMERDAPNPIRAFPLPLGIHRGLRRSHTRPSP